MTTATCLSDIDIRIFSLLAEGFTQAEVAVEMNYSRVNVAQRISVSCAKLGARNTASAIAVLVRKQAI